jgi:hypothetical protein
MATQPNLPATRPPRGGLPLWTALAALLIVALAAIGGLGFVVYYLRSEKAELQRRAAQAEAQAQRHDLDQKEAAEKGRLVQAQNQQQDVLRQAQAATNTLLQVLATRDALFVEAAALRTNDAGRTVALHPELVPLAGRLYESGLTDVPPESDIVTRLEAVRRIAQQVRESSGTAYVPPPDLAGTVQTDAAWAALAQAKVDQVRQALNSLVRESQVKFTRATLTADSPTLSAAIARRNEEVAGTEIKLAEQIVATARTNAVLTRAKAGAEATTTQAEADATAITTRAETEAARLLAAAQQEAADLRRKQAEDLAAKEREWQQHKADLEFKAATNRVAVQNTIDAARKIELRKKASDPEVQSKLKYFTTPGYVGVSGKTPEKKPLSFQQLQASGALAPTIAGQNKLVKIAIDEHDSVRPRWGLHAIFYRRHDEQIQQVQETQKLLLELGPTLVELGELAP